MQQQQQHHQQQPQQLQQQPQLQLQPRQGQQQHIELQPGEKKCFKKEILRIIITKRKLFFDNFWDFLEQKLKKNTL